MNQDLRQLVWFLESRVAGQPTQPAQMGSGVVVWLRNKASAQRRKYLLTCAHVVRGPAADGVVGGGPVLSDLLAWEPGKGFTKATDFPQRMSDKPIPGAFRVVASPLALQPTVDVAPSERLAANDWILLEVADPRFQHVSAVSNWAQEASGSLTVVGYPGGSVSWKTGETVQPTSEPLFEFHKEPEPGIANVTGPAETRPGMSGGGVFNEQGELVAIHRARQDAQMAGQVILVSHIRAELAARGYEVVPYETETIKPLTPAELRWQRTNLALATVLACGCAIWSLLVLSVLLFSLVAGVLSSLGISALLAFLFPQSGWATRMQAASRFLRRASTGYTLIALFVGGFALSASGTTIRVASLPDLPDDVTTVELRWGDANHTSQDVLANGGWKWHWTGWGADTVTFVSPGYAPLPLLVRPWKQTVLYGFDDFEPLPFVIITFPDPPPSTMPDRVKARDKEFRWKLQVSSRLQGASAWENPHWSADEDYYVGDPLVLGGNGADWPEDRSLPAGVSVALVHRPLQPLSLSATRDYRVFVADQHDVIRLSAEITAVEIRAIREPIRIELKEP